MDRELTYEHAADWVQRLDQPELSEQDIQSWLEWFAASDQNRKAFEEMRTLRRRFRALEPALRSELSVKLKLPPHRQHSLKRPLAIAAALMMMAVGVGTVWKFHTRASMATYAAPSDQHRSVLLQDGSEMALAANSKVAVKYSSAQRRLIVESGGAYFEVRQEAARPFVVEVGTVRVKAIGTAFNVQRKAEGVSVTVTEGKVVVSAHDTDSPRGARLLSAGQKTVVPLHGARPSARSQVAMPEWHDERADFVDAPLSQVIELINRHSSAKLVIDDPRIADLTYSGTIFRPHLDEWILSLPEVYPLRAVPLEDGTVSLVSRKTRQP